MSLKRMLSTVLLMGAALMVGCDETGPGMTVTWETRDKEHYISLQEIRWPSGSIQKMPIAITYVSGKVAGFAPDNRVIPQWIELLWIEPIDYKDERSAPSIKDRVTAMEQLPVKRQRVEVGSRIPKEVIEQAVDAVKRRKTGQLPEKYLWVYFTWKAGHVYFRWQLRQVYGAGANTSSTVLVSGGDSDPG